LSKVKNKNYESNKMERVDVSVQLDKKGGEASLSPPNESSRRNELAQENFDVYENDDVIDGF